MILSFLFLHPWPMHIKTASSYGIMNARQSKAEQKSNKYCLVKRGKSKQKFSTWLTPFPIASEVRVQKSKHPVFLFDSISRPPKGKGCLTYELTPWEFSEFLKCFIALLSLSFIPRQHIMLKNCLSLNRQVYVWVELLQLSFFAFHIPNRD